MNIIEPLGGKVMKLGTQIEDSLIINNRKFGVSNSNSQAPPIDQICANVSANNFWNVKDHIQSNLAKSYPKLFDISNHFRKAP